MRIGENFIVCGSYIMNLWYVKIFLLLLVPFMTAIQDVESMVYLGGKHKHISFFSVLKISYD